MCGLFSLRLSVQSVTLYDASLPRSVDVHGDEATAHQEAEKSKESMRTAVLQWEYTADDRATAHVATLLDCLVRVLFGAVLCCVVLLALCCAGLCCAGLCCAVSTSVRCGMY